MALHPLAGKIAPKEILINVPKIVTDYFALTPGVADINQQVSFGTSGHRGTSSNKSFNEAHILAISQAIVEYRIANNIDGILFVGMDTHALSVPAQVSALEVFATNGVEVRWCEGYTPTPVISHAILCDHPFTQSTK